MRNVRGLVMIGISLLAAVAAMVLALRWLTEQTTVATEKVVVATVDLNVGENIDPKQMRLVDWPAGVVPSGAFKRVEDLEGRVAKTTILRDEPIMEAKLAPKGTRGGLSAVIAEGKRAITVRVNDVIGVAGFALPGNYVDVIVNTRDDATVDRERSVSKIVLEKILVLAVAQEASRDDTKPKVVSAVTLEVTPLEAEKIDLARSVGTLSLVLRNQIDSNAVKTTGATKESLLGNQAPAPVAVNVSRPAPVRTASVARATPPKPARRHCVEMLAGSERTVECF